jgi:hypothetical protein
VGFSPDTELIFGVPMPEPYDSYSGEVKDGYDEEIGEWQFESDILEVAYYGHYDDPEGPRGILTMKSVERFRGDAWTPTAISLPEVWNEDRYRAADEAERLGLNFADPKWYLVAGYG